LSGIRRNKIYKKDPPPKKDSSRHQGAFSQCRAKPQTTLTSTPRPRGSLGLGAAPHSGAKFIEDAAQLAPGTEPQPSAYASAARGQSFGDIARPGNSITQGRAKRSAA